MVAQGPQDLGQVIHHKAVSIREHLSADDVHLPPWDIKMDPVQECGIIKLFRQFTAQIRMFQHVRDGMPGIAHKDHGGFGAQCFDAQVGKGGLIYIRLIVQFHPYRSIPH